MTPSYSRFGHAPQRLPAGQQGFVLIAVLGLVMIISLVGAFVSHYAERRVSQAMTLRAHWQTQLDQDATLATVLHLLATRPRGSQGIELAPLTTAPTNNPALTTLVPTARQLAADSRPYRGIGNSTFALQDEGALLSVLEPNQTYWQALLTGRFALSPSAADRVIDLINDYTDKDDLARLNGATDADYKARGLTPPSHHFMVTPSQLYNLLDASQWHGWLPQLLPLVTSRTGMLFNLNTMPEALLTVRLDSATAAELVRLRRDKPFASLADANQRLGKLLPLDEMTIPAIVSSFFRVELWPAGPGGCRQAHWIGLSLAPSSLRAPWEIDYAFSFDPVSACQPPQRLVVAPLFQPPVAG